jgi:hypothetical protein
MAAVTIMTMYEASARTLDQKHVDQLHWVDVYVSVSAILLIWVGAWVWCFTVKKPEYYRDLMTTSNVRRQSVDLEVRRHTDLAGVERRASRHPLTATARALGVP